MRRDETKSGAKLGRSLRVFGVRRSAIALRRAEEGESPRTIVIALLANVAIGVAKLLAGIVSRSGGLIAEAAHSAADCVNELFLAIGLYRAGSRRTPPIPSGTRASGSSGPSWRRSRRF